MVKVPPAVVPISGKSEVLAKLDELRLNVAPKSIANTEGARFKIEAFIVFLTSGPVPFLKRYTTVDSAISIWFLGKRINESY
ncbi:hypothetical protein VCO01S_06990 [Vibrio comitans NBRC 102076]|uniref:Uncharacterized protein n=1 Tax=Vibrio comitans NBRC 102076 TaxID=1219078 RepID=A0A4Y3IJF2_9VIBR|nr:hypothetical protein VCO01S_06990 [Vibrio comitans NBRC 102076]